MSARHYLVKAVVPAMERMPSASGVETGYAATFHRKQWMRRRLRRWT
jgi:hypothetical protein